MSSHYCSEFFETLDKAVSFRDRLQLKGREPFIYCSKMKRRTRSQYVTEMMTKQMMHPEISPEYFSQRPYCVAWSEV